jgi:hypothetical protein
MSHGSQQLQPILSNEPSGETRSGANRSEKQKWRKPRHFIEDAEKDQGGKEEDSSADTEHANTNPGDTDGKVVLE